MLNYISTSVTLVKGIKTTMKGIILAGGSGTRLYPLTQTISKQLLPIYDKPMIYYPLSVLMLAGITEILIISTPTDLPNFRKMFGDGKQYGLQLEYVEQPNPDGLAQAFILGRDFIGTDDVCLILGDNIFYGHGIINLLQQAKTNVEQQQKATVFGYYVTDPERYGVAEFNKDGEVISIEEKPQNPKSNYAVVGLYFYPNNVVEKVTHIQPSARGELEITSLNELYLKDNQLNVAVMGRGYAWLDTGTQASLLEAGNFIQTIEERQGLKVACIEEIAYEMGYITKEELIALAKPLGKSQYGQYLTHRAKDNTVKQ